MIDDPHGARPEPPQGSWSRRVDPATGLELPDPFPEYARCPHCGEAEVEVWCYQDGVRCHNCGQWVAHAQPPGCGTYPFCKRGEPPAGVQPG